MKTKMKKLSLFLAVLLLFTLTFTACDSSSNNSGTSSVSSEQESNSIDETSENQDVSSEDISEPEPTAEPTKSPEELDDEKINEILDDMSLEQQVSQMFMLRFIGANGSFNEVNDDMISFVQRNNPAGYVLFTDNITTREGTRALTDAIRENSDFPPFVGIDEEGGLVSRLASAGLDGYEPQPPAMDIGDTGDTTNAYDVGAYIGATLNDIGVDVDFAPDADVLTNPDNTVIGNRAFSSDPQVVADMMSSFIDGLHDNGIMTAPKHFPGHGGTSGDSHDGSVYIDYDEDHLNSVEYVPFKRAISEGTEFVLVGHILDPTVDDSNLPSSLSHYFVTEQLRDNLGFEGIIITDAMDMGAIAENYSPGESSVLAIKAGIDIILMPSDYEQAIEGVMGAIEDGDITEERIRESAYRVVKAKLNSGLLG